MDFNESEVLRAFDPSGGQCAASGDGTIKLWYNDEHALTLGVRRVIVKTIGGTTTTDYPVSPLLTDPGHATNPDTGTNAQDGDQAGTDTSSCAGFPDVCDRPMWPSLFVTDITFNANDRSGDWQFGGVPNNPNDVFGTWKAAVRTVDKTKSPTVITVTPDADPAQNDWNLDGGDPVPPGAVNQGYGAEVRWNLGSLHDKFGNPLQPNHLYRIQFMVHDGDQNKTGGDVGEACTNVLIPPGFTTPTSTPTVTPTNTPTNTPTPTPTTTASTPTPPACTTCLLTYPDNSNPPRSQVQFNENEVLRAFDPSQTCASGGGTIKLWYNDEHALTLGVRQVVVKTASGTTTTNYPVSPLLTDPGHAANPQTGTNAQDGDQAGTDTSSCAGFPDVCDRPMWPSLFVTDITFNANDRSGDWQFGGVPNNPNDVFGTWKAAVRMVDKTKSPTAITVTPDSDPAKNDWNLGPGSDPVPPGLVNQGYGAEVRWNLGSLHDKFGNPLLPGHMYRVQFMVHDGDQNKTGGDVGEACTNVLVPPGFTTPTPTPTGTNTPTPTPTRTPGPGGEICFQCTTFPDVNAQSSWVFNGDGSITIHTVMSKNFVDNTYGANAIGWPNGHSFGNLTGSDELTLALYDNNNVKQMEFKIDYLTASAGAPSGYKTLCVTGGDGGMITGNASDVVGCLTSLDVNFNTFGYVLTTDSPATDANYTPNPQYPNWIFDVWYEVTVKPGPFAAGGGFQKPLITNIHASPSKKGQNTCPMVVVPCPP